MTPNPTGGNKKVGLRPPRRATRFRAKLEYIATAGQKQDKAGNRAGSASVRSWMQLVRGNAGGLACSGINSFEISCIAWQMACLGTNEWPVGENSASTLLRWAWCACQAVESGTASVPVGASAGGSAVFPQNLRAMTRQVRPVWRRRRKFISELGSGRRICDFWTRKRLDQRCLC
jgi:hypothetical protein